MDSVFKKSSQVGILLLFGLTLFSGSQSFALSTASYTTSTFDSDAPSHSFLGSNSVEDMYFYDTTGEPWANPTTSNFTGYSRTGQHYTNGSADAGTPSWVSEGANTHRGSETAFPTKALLVSTDESVEIINLDTNRLWMRFQANTNTMLTGSSDTGTYKGISMNNGILYIAHTSAAGGGLVRIDFTKDEGMRIEETGGGRLFSAPISGRNTPGTFTDSNTFPNLSHKLAYDTAGERISGKDYVAVATEDGITLINEQDKTRVLYKGTSVGRSMRHVLLTTGGELYFSRFSVNDNGNNFVVAFHDVQLDTGTKDWDTEKDAAYGSNFLISPIAPSTGETIKDISLTENTSSAFPFGNTLYISTTSGLTVIQEQPRDPRESTFTHFGYIGSGNSGITNKVLAGSTDSIGSAGATKDGRILFVGTNDNSNGGAVSVIDMNTRERIAFYQNPTLLSNNTKKLLTRNNKNEFIAGSLSGISRVTETHVLTDENNERSVHDRTLVVPETGRTGASTALTFSFKNISGEAFDTVEVTFHSPSGTPPSVDTYTVPGGLSLTAQHVWEEDGGTYSIASSNPSLTLTRTNGATVSNTGLASFTVSGFTNAGTIGDYIVTIKAKNGSTIIGEGKASFTLADSIALSSTLSTTGSSLSFMIGDNGVQDNPLDSTANPDLTLGEIATTILSDSVNGKGTDGNTITVTNTFPGYTILLSDSANGMANVAVAGPTERTTNDSTNPSNNALFDYEGATLPSSNQEAYFFSVTGTETAGTLLPYNKFTGTTPKTIVESPNAVTNEAHTVNIFAQRHTDTVGGTYSDEITYTVNPNY